MLGGDPEEITQKEAEKQIGVYNENKDSVFLIYPSGVYIERLSDGRYNVQAIGEELETGSLEQAEKFVLRVMRDELGIPADIGFFSTHFDEPNILAHIRMDDRVDQDGNKVLFIEEIQSDWAQAGRKGIFTKGEDYGVPVGPFVTETKNWVALALKRILALAGNEGYNKVAFINGQQSAERYDLRKQIRKIDAKKNIAGTYLLDVEFKQRQGERYAKTDTVLAKDEKELAEYVGKELAQKIAKDLNPEINLNTLSVEQNEDFETFSVYSGDFKVSPNFSSLDDARDARDSLRAGIAKPTPPRGSKMYTGLDLATGGEGMLAFYDSIVPQVAKKVIEKVGGKNLSEINVDDIGIQTGIEITPEMATNIAAGQRLFSRKAVPGTSQALQGEPRVLPTPEQVAPEPRSQEALTEAVAKANKDTERTPKTSVPLYGPNASPEALYVALNPEMGAKFDLEDTIRYSRRGNEPQYPPNIQKLIDQTPAPADETMGQTFIKILQMPSSKDFWDNIRQGLVFRGARLERQYRENPELAKMMADTSALALYQMTDHSRAMTQAAITGGIPVYENGGFKVVPFVYKGKPIERGLLEIMAPLHSKEHGNLERLAHRYAMAIRGERLNNEGKLTPIAPGELQALEAEIQKYRNPATGQPVVKEWYDMWQAYNSNIVKYLQKTGVIDDAGAQLWMKQSDYIPFYREKADGTLMHPKVFGGLHTAGQFKAVGKSSEDLNVDMVTAIVNNIDTAIAMGMKNVAQQRIIRDQINLGLASVLKQGETVGDRNSVSFKIAGKRYTAIIEDPLIYESMLPANEIPMDGLFGTMFRFPANLLRELIIRDPGYMAANMFRDTLSSYVITGAEVVPLWGTAKGFAGDIDKLRKLGVIGGYDLRMDKNGVRDFYDKEAKKMGMVAGVNWLNPVMAAWDVLGRISERSEAATRLAVYEDILKRTGNEVEAQYQALSVMNYGRRGNNPLLRMITALVPFLNARIQGLDKLYQATTGRVGAKYKTDTSGKVIPEVQRRKNFARFLFRAGLITGITALYYAMVSDDDEYENASPEIRDNYYIIPVMKGDTESGEPGLSVRLPIPFEIGIMFKVIPERLIAGIYGDDTSKDFKDSMKRALFSTLAMNPTPQAILPIGEAMVNKDLYTGRPIVPYYMENLLPEQQKTFYTNVVAEDIANKMGFSPMKVDHVLRGYGGTLGGYLMQAVDSMARENEMVLPSTEWYQKPFIKRFFATANQPGLQNKFYELKGDVDGITQTINRLNEEGRYDELATFYAKNGHMYEMRKDLNYLEKQITRLRDQRKIIEQMDIDPEAKRQQIEQINMMISATLTSVPMYRKTAYDKE